MMVNVIVDSDQMKLLDLSKDELEKVISDVASINPSRGDELNVSFFPFIEKSFGIQQFYAKNKKMLTYMGHVLDKLRWVIVGIISLIVFGGIGFLIYWLFRKKMAERAQVMEEEKARRFEEEKLKVKEKLDAIEEKRKAVVNLAQSKPDDIATLILNWIEAFEGEEGKKNVPGS
jgi:flagellar biosynthesis/type III secretory pathway M-ring protein FliF/YscJ